LADKEALLAAIIVHGGCGVVTHLTRPVKEAGTKRAVEAGLAALRDGGNAVDAVEAAVKVLEDDPVFNAGTGSVLTLDGEVETDASVMTSRLECGAVAALRGVKNPITLARRVMEITDHVFLAGPGADHFAKVLGLPQADLVTEERRERWKAIRARMEQGDLGADELEHWARIGDYVRPYLEREERHTYSTVGATAIDDSGLLAAGTSTGGIWFKLPGRVGDTPIIGAGTYADEHGAISSTGHGEGIVKLCLAQRAVSFMATMSAQEAVDRAVADASRHHVDCGLIGVDARGTVGCAFNTEDMPTACG